MTSNKRRFNAIQCCTHKCRLSEVNKFKSKSKSKPKLELELDFELKSSITDELLIEILIRLPSIYACRYKAVCKHWHHLISSDYFIRRFIDHQHQLNGSQFIPDSFTLVFQYTFWCSSPSGAPHTLLFQDMRDHPDPVLSNSYNGLHFLPPLRLNNNSKSKHMYKKMKGAEVEPVYVQTSCHDLLLCSRFQTYYVVNLLTRQWMVLPPAPSLDHGQQSILDAYPKVGLLCHHDYCRFKVILVCVPQVGNCSVYTIRIFCSESGKWTKRMVDWYPWTKRSSLGTSDMIPHSGMLHWLNGDSLVSLDPFNGDPDFKLSRAISLPPDGEFFSPRFRFGVSQGHLCLAHNKIEDLSSTSYLHLWQLEDYHKGLWRLQYRVRFPSIARLMDFHPYKRDIIFVQQEEFVYHLNMQTGKFDKYLKLKDCPGILLFHAVVLLHPWFPTPLPAAIG